MPPYNLGDLTPDLADPDREALVDHRPGGRRWTYRQIEAAASEVGRRLLAAGCRRGDSIAIIAENSAEFLVCYFGAMRVGLVAAPLNFKLPSSTIALLLDDCDARLVLVDARHRRLAGTGRPVVDVGDLADRDAPIRVDPAMFPEDGEIAEILYTSGSTGRPKGVPLSHAGQLWAISVHRQADPPPRQTTIVSAPLYHMNALFNIYVSLINGVRIILMPRFEARAWLAAILEFNCTMLSGIPSMLTLAARERDIIETSDFRFVERILVGSAPLSASVLEQMAAMFPNALITNGYGTTEAGPSVFGDHPRGLARPPLALGYPLASIDVRLDGDTPDEGVLAMRTPAQLAGYHNLPDATAERIRDGWYITGDIMRRDANGFYFFVGRIDDMFVCGGENLYPAEIETLVERHPDVLQAAVVPAPDHVKGEIPIAFVVPAPGRAPDPAVLKAFTLAEGPAYAHPRAFVILDQLPVAGTHKIDKRKLVELALEVAATLDRDRAGRGGKGI